jgi:hypothetical protein
MSSLLLAWAHVEESVYEQYEACVAQAAATLSARAWHFDADPEPSLGFPDAPPANVLTM